MDYSKMTDDQLDELVAKNIGQWTNTLRFIIPFSKDVALAWKVMDAAKQKGVSFDIHEPAKGTRSVVAFVGDHSFKVVNDNPARAICEAALMAVEVVK